MGKVLWRIIEFILIIFIAIVTLPFFLLAILLIQIDSPGPIFLKQERVGKDNKIFRLFKLRTMKEGADGTSPMHTQVNDQRFSKLCRFIRATTLDEIPQFVNVLIGNMSLIGPRPERAKVVEGYSPEQLEVLNYTPGLFGISQLAFREGVVVEEKISLECAYYRQRTFITDMKILLYTPIVVLRDAFGKLNGNKKKSEDRLDWIKKVLIKT